MSGRDNVNQKCANGIKDPRGWEQVCAGCLRQTVAGDAAKWVEARLQEGIAFQYCFPVDINFSYQEEGKIFSIVGTF